ncbi:gamma-glutamylcyclotransferase-like [Diadema setosum]|uniref:gamma-glutamylcyclotransferase-like n=1 Tax=Diadema setosum TaxID=31175 RepID=UPI003B3BBFE7
MEASADDTFLYFGFGSNLLLERIKLKNPTAVFVDVAFLTNYKLCFGNTIGSRWHGGAASIMESEGDTVWGVVWRLKQTDLPSLDDQEGKDEVYNRLQVTVQSQERVKYTCWTYQMIHLIEELPSPQYLLVIRKGAEQNKLPEDYRKWLYSIPDNGYDGDVEILHALDI